MKTFFLAAYITLMKVATLTSSFLLFNEGIKQHDDLLIVLSWIMGAFFLCFLSFNWIIKELKA